MSALLPLRTLAFAALLVSTPAMAAENSVNPLEQKLLSAMRYSEKSGQRLTEPGPVVRAYIQAGLVGRKPNRRMDYTDYRIFKGPATLFGQTLVVLEEEYLTEFIGCCVNAGIGAIVRVTDDAAELKGFAERNKCKISDDHVADDLKALGMTSADGKYLSVSCRERDAF